MTERGLLIVFSGPSGAGKDTILRMLLRQRGDCLLSVSTTTRPPRPGEVDGKDYFFITKERFREMVSHGKMLEYAEYSGNFYGTPVDAVEQSRSEGRNVILEIDVQGALQVKEKCPDAVFVFVTAPSLSELRRRLEQRKTESVAVIAQRLDLAKAEFASIREYDYIIINSTVSESCRKLDAIITASACSTRRMNESLQEESNNA